MKLFLPVLLLGGSLVANVWLANRALPATAPASAHTASAAGATSAAATSASSATPSAAGKIAAAPARLTPIVWTPPGTTDGDLRGLADRLRAAGFPPRSVAAVVGVYLRDREYAQLAEQPFWQLMNPGKETRELRLAADKALREKQQTILGADGSAVASLPPSERTLRYGNLSDAKVEALLALDRDYQALDRAARGPGGVTSMAEYRAMTEQRLALENEKRADLAAILSPEELAAYELRSSSSANRVMGNLRTTTVTAEEYAALVKLQQNFEGATGGVNLSAATTPEERASWRNARLDYNEQLRAVLAPETFAQYLAASDSDYGQVARFAEKQPALTPAVAYELYKLQGEAQLVMRNASDVMRQRIEGASSSPEVMRAAMNERRAAQAALNARLEALLGADLAAAYRKEGGAGMYFPASANPSANSGTMISPAVRLPGTGG